MQPGARQPQFQIKLPLPEGKARGSLFPLEFQWDLPSEIERKRAQGHVIQSQDGEIFQLNKSGW